MTEDVYFRETLNQGGRGREGGNNCSVNLQGYIDESNLSSPTIIYAQWCDSVLVHWWGGRGGFYLIAFGTFVSSKRILWESLFLN